MLCTCEAASSLWEEENKKTGSRQAEREASDEGKNRKTEAENKRRN